MVCRLPWPLHRASESSQTQAGFVQRDVLPSARWPDPVRQCQTEPFFVNRGAGKWSGVTTEDEEKSNPCEWIAVVIDTR